MGLEERAAQGLELAELVLPVSACGAARLGVAETPLPTAQCVGADAEQLGGRVGSNTAHSSLLVGKIVRNL